MIFVKHQAESFGGWESSSPGNGMEILKFSAGFEQEMNIQTRMSCRGDSLQVGEAIAEGDLGL